MRLRQKEIGQYERGLTSVCSGRAKQLESYQSASVRAADAGR
jgi:hypothetical protein